MTKWISVVVVCALFSGCASLTTSDKTKPKSKKDNSWFSWKKKEYQVPHSMAVIWSEDVLTTPGKPPTRGFGGRIYFYNEKSQAIPVEGELLVYGYDESAPKPAGTAAPAADKRFRFTAEQFTEHFSESELGASYSIWIPWDAAGGFSKKITLIPTFTTKDGRLIRAEASKTTLAGRSPTGQPDYSQSSVQQVSHIEPTNPGFIPGAKGMPTPDQSMRTTTIQLPSDTTRRLTTPVVSETNNTSVRYGNGMTQEQMNAILAQGVLGGGFPNAHPNMNVPGNGFNVSPQLQQAPITNTMNGANGVAPQQQPNVPQNAFGTKPIPMQGAIQPPTGGSINGSGNPGFAQQDWSQLSAGSLWSQFPAQGIATAPQGSSPAR